MSGAPVKRRRFDSDDDEDEYVAGASNSPLLQHAVSTPFPTDEMPSLDDGEGEGDAVDTLLSIRVTVPSTHLEADSPTSLVKTTADGPALGQPIAAASRKPHLPLEEDEDIPAEYKGLISAELLRALFVPLDYICKQRRCTDVLLSQYAPAVVASSSTPGRKLHHKAYGIAPGFRWDGVVRGRGPVD
ncbi:Pre-mRNA-splicing factor of RES complex, putative [Leishmania lindenbergi]|uniref:Pre-mRNA-splicing factor of RES complex n=1 Tax=Leishmania lindenbergi TaxID=651832 RepID=A0AAW3AC63_9TRYP